MRALSFRCVQAAISVTVARGAGRGTSSWWAWCTRTLIHDSKHYCCADVDVDVSVYQHRCPTVFPCMKHLRSTEHTNKVCCNVIAGLQYTVGHRGLTGTCSHPHTSFVRPAARR